MTARKANELTHCLGRTCVESYTLLLKVSYVAPQECITVYRQRSVAKNKHFDPKQKVEEWLEKIADEQYFKVEK